MNYFDLHCDTPYECYERKINFTDNQLAVSYEKGLQFEKWIQTFAIWINDNTKNPFALYKRIINDFKSKIKEIPCNLTSLFMVEGGAVIEDNIDLLYELKNDDIKFITLTWNGENNIAGGSKTDKGLTDFGKQVIYKMNSLNIGCDLSHLNDRSFFKAVEYSEKPLATHSNCRSVCDCKRNLTDEQIKLITEKNGVIGLCFYPEFLGENPFEKFYKNIYHLLEMGFENNICIGSDFDGALMTGFINDISEVPVIYKYLLKKGISNNILEKVFYNNAFKFVSNL